MKKETQRFLDFVDRELKPGSLTIEKWEEYITRLPDIYQNDLSFRLHFDWHWQLDMKIGRAGIGLSFATLEDPIYIKQIRLINEVGRQLYGLNYQYREIILLHARTNLRGQCLLEIGGSLPNDLLFKCLQIESYVNIESPDYIEAERGSSSYSSKHGEHENRETIFCNAEELNKKILPNSIDIIFSVACFEHIYDLPSALEACFKCSKKGGSLYSYFAPIYSELTSGDHGSIRSHEKFPEKPIGLHLLAPNDQRKKLMNAGIDNTKEIQDYLGHVNFWRLPNRLLYEDYERICTESPYHVLELDRHDTYNLSKIFPNEFHEIRKSNTKIGNMMSSGFRVHLLKP